MIIPSGNEKRGAARSTVLLLFFDGESPFISH